MYIPSNLKQIILFEGNVDFRKRFDGLLALCYQHSYNPYRGDCIVFLSRDKHELRALLGDKYGLFLVCRRFEGGVIRASFEKKKISLGELTFLLQGTCIKIQGQVAPWQDLDKE